MALVEAARYFNSFEGGLAKARLEAAGIPSFLFGLEVNPAFAGGVFNVRLMVDDEDVEEVMELLAEGA